MRRNLAAAAALAGLLATGGCGGGDQSPTAPPANFGLNEVITTPATRDVSSVTWYGDYRAPYSLDPIKVADYPEETTIPNICQGLLRAGPDYTLRPNLATAWQQVDPSTLVFTIRSGVKFSDGTPMTVDDVVYSLRRNTVPANASSFAEMYASVKSIDKTGDNQVTVRFSRPNVMFLRAAATGGTAVVSKAYVEAKKEAFGTPQGGVLCTGPYQVASFDGSTKPKLIDL
jgi:peptide/nickel transport system substrate-binding protein